MHICILVHVYMGICMCACVYQCRYVLLSVCQFARATVTKCYKLGSLHDRNLSSHGSGGQRSEVKVLAGLMASGGLEGESVPGLSQTLAGLWSFLACRNITLVSVFIFT